MSAASKRKPLQRPFVGVLAVVIQRAVEVDGNNPYEQARWLQRAVDRNKGVHALLDESERLWMECRSSVVALDDAAYVQHACDALAAMLQAIMWVVTLRQAPVVPAVLRGAGPARWLVGAWPVEQPRTTPRSLEWPSPFMAEPDLVASMQNAVLHMAYALDKRLDRMGVEPPAIEVAA